MGRFGEFVVNHWMLSSALVVVVLLLVATELRRKVLGYKDIKPQEAVRLMNHEEAQMVDVRDDQEYQQGRVVNALHIPLGLLQDRLAELEQFRDRPIVVYCRTGQRSAHAAVLLEKNGFKRVYKLSGGMLAWQSAGLPVTKKS